MTVPRKLNLGSGTDFRVDYLNVDVQAHWQPDVLADLSLPGLFDTPQRFETDRFGEVNLVAECLDEVLALDVLEHVPNLVGMMTNILHLLRVDGRFRISVPYDLSYGAWQDPTHLRAWNERSWLYYTDWFWYLGWSTHRFTLDQMEMVLNPIGQDLLARGINREDLLRTPRAVDSMNVVLRKIALTEGERQLGVQMRSRQTIQPG
jgi:hypothetical protein